MSLVQKNLEKVNLMVEPIMMNQKSLQWIIWKRQWKDLARTDGIENVYIEIPKIESEQNYC